jgi:hypothetical protein
MRGRYQSLADVTYADASSNPLPRALWPRELSISHGLQCRTPHKPQQAHWFYLEHYTAFLLDQALRATKTSHTVSTPDMPLSLSTNTL